MEIFIPSILIGSGICFFAGLQFCLFGLSRTQERVFLAFGILCLLLGIYMLFSAQWYATSSVEEISVIARIEMGIICLIYPVFIWFLGLYSEQQSYKKFLIVSVPVFAFLFIINIWSEYSFLYNSINLDLPIILPWGEKVSDFKTEVAPIAWLYYLATYSIFFWSLYCCYRLWVNKFKTRAISISIYLILQIIVILHAELIDNLNIKSVYLGEFVFLLLVVLITVTLVAELRVRSFALEKSIDNLRLEKAQREVYENKLEYMAHHDYLTNLPNRRALSNKLETAMAICKQTRTYGAMLLVDLDHFKMINDSLGHDIGDRLLQLIAERLKIILPEESQPVRLGGDEFAVFFAELSPHSDKAEEIVTSKTQAIRAEITRPYQIAEHELVIGASIGIALFDYRSNQYLPEIMKRADMALYHAKAFGRNCIELYAPQLQKEADRRLFIDEGMRTAIEHGEIQVYFQPQINSADQVVGAEVLARWKHPSIGFIPPLEFITVAEETGMIHALGEHILRQTCLHLKRWKQLDQIVPEQLSVNVSPWQLDNSGFVNMVKTILNETGIVPSWLNLEITESTFMRDINSVSEKINSLSELGVTFSIDDFGTGYSALAWLKTLPLHGIKIDKTFIRNMNLKQHDKLIETIIAIAEHTDMRVVAEGVETEAQFNALEKMGCHVFQGYLISKPLSEPEFSRWLHDKHQLASNVTKI